MKSSNLIRLGGLAAVLAGMLFVVVDLLEAVVIDLDNNPGEEAATAPGPSLPGYRWSS